MAAGGEKPAAAAAPDLRAPARVHPVLTAVNERVEYISELMRDNVWSYETSHALQKELSATWECARSTIRNYSAEANHSRLDEVRERRAEVARKAVNALLEVAESAVVMPGDKAAKVNASKTLLEFAGLDKPDEDKIQKHAIVGVGLEDIDALRRSMESNECTSQGPKKSSGNGE